MVRGAQDRGITWAQAMELYTNAIREQASVAAVAAEARRRRALEDNGAAEGGSVTEGDEDDGLGDFIVDGSGSEEEDAEENSGDNDDGKDQEKQQQRARSGGGSSSPTGFYRSRAKMFGEYCHILCIARRSGFRSMAIQSRPNTGTNSNPVHWADVRRVYRKYDIDPKP